MSCVIRAMCAMTVAIGTACGGAGAEREALEVDGAEAAKPPPEPEPVVPQEERATVAEAIAAWERWERAFTLASPAAISVRYAEDAVLVIGDAAPLAGASRIGRYYELLLAGLPDLEREVLVAFARDGEVAVVAHARGMHRGEVMGAPATAESIGRTELARLQIDQRGLITRHEVFADALNLTAQLRLRDLDHRDAGDALFAGAEPLVAIEAGAGAVSSVTSALLEAWSAGDAEGAAALFSPSGVLHDAAAVADAVGPRAIAAHARELGAAFSDVRIRELEIWTAGSHALATFLFTGVHSGTWARLGLRGSGARFEIRAALVVDAAEGAEEPGIARAGWFYDGLALAAALEADD
jgi:hypothetical protein